VAVVGDLAGLFGHGSSGEGCDAEDLRLPGVQADLLAELLPTGTPVVVVVVGAATRARVEAPLRLATGEKRDSHHVELATELVVRQSTAALRE